MHLGACTRDTDMVSLGLTAFAALMGDAGAASGEPLESYRATTETTGVPDLSPLGRYTAFFLYTIDITLLPYCTITFIYISHLSR